MRRNGQVRDFLEEWAYRPVYRMMGKDYRLYEPEEQVPDMLQSDIADCPLSTPYIAGPEQPCPSCLDQLRTPRSV